MRPFRHELFRTLWLITVASQLATWMQNAAAGWQMTVLVDSALPVALLQTATSLPFLLVGMPSGALADLVERRLVIVGSHLWLAASAALLAALTAAGAASPWVLLALTFSIGFGTAVNNPTLLAAMTDAVPRPDLAGATTLASAAINTARAGGPPVAGILIALASTAAAFALVAVAFLTVAVVAARLKPAPSSPHSPPGAKPSFRRLLAIRRFRIVLARTALFIAGASAIWALLPLIAARHLELGPQGFGVLLGLMGAGAVLGAVVLAPLRAWLSTEVVAIAGTSLFAGASVLLSSTTSPAAGAALMLALGFGWLSTRSTLTVAAQISAPVRARGRAFAAQMLIWHGGQAVGGIVWALVAQRLGLPAALLGSGLILCAGLVATRLLPLPPDDPALPEIELQLSRADA